MDVPGGRVSTGPTSGDGGWDEHSGGVPGVRPAPGHGAQDCGLLSAAGLPATDPAPASQAGALTGVIDQILADDLRRPRKQRHTAQRIFQRPREEHGFGGQYTIVKDYVREHRRRPQKMFVPLSHSPGHAHCDFGRALMIVPLSPTGSELLFEIFSQRYEQGSILTTTNLPFDEWTEVFGSERLTGALLDRLTHHVHILEMNGDSYRLCHGRDNAASQASEQPDDS